MSAAGLITEGIFRAFGLAPTTRPTKIVADHFSWNYTAYLNLVFLALFGLLYWVHRNREELGGGGGLSVDPVCGMQIDQTNAPASLVYAGERVYFCSDGCRTTFEADSARLAAG
jgi:YHS domain-containing protein